MWPHGVLAALALWCAWRPVETVPATAVVVAAAVLVLLPWAWQRRAEGLGGHGLAALAMLLVLLVASAAGGWDRAAAVHQLALVAAVASLVFVASRSAPPERALAALVLGLAALSLWGLWQVTVSFDRALAAAAELTGPLRDFAVGRFSSRRAFASQMFPGHLAVLLATALALLLPGGRSALARAPWLRWLGLALCAVGLAITFSPIGILIAAAACGTVLLARRRWALPVLAAAVLGGLVLAVVARPDVARLEPLALRSDNWRTALWLWSTAPVSGAGFASYGQASQAVPFAVGNRPVHAHSLPLEWLAELGLAGAALAILGAVVLLRVSASCWRERPGLAVAVLLVPLHNLVDFSLYVSGVALPWAVLAGWAWALGRGEDREPQDGRGRAWVVAACGAALLAAACHATSVVVEAAFSAADDPRQVVEACRKAHRLAPWRTSPPLLAASVALAGHDPELQRAAASLLDGSAWLQPRSLTAAMLRSRLAWTLGRAPTAVGWAWQAVSSRPADPVPATELELMLQRLAEGEGR